MNIVSNSGLNPKEKMLLQSLADGVPVETNASHQKYAVDIFATS